MRKRKMGWEFTMRRSDRVVLTQDSRLEKNDIVCLVLEVH